VVKKVGSQYKVISHTSGKSMGSYPSKAQAWKRLAQIKYFAKKKGK